MKSCFLAMLQRTVPRSVPGYARYSKWLFVTAVTLMAARSGSAPAEERPALNASKISVPSGPGSVEGMGESFEPQWNSGTYRLSVPLKLPKLRGAVQPEIALGYDSGNGNGPAGLGWRLSLPFLQRQTDKGMPRHTAEDTIIDWTGEELVRLADGTLRAENEGGFVRWENLGEDGWRGTRPDGTVLRFGATAAARLDRPTALGGGTFRWLLESAEDTNGNRVVYRYTADRASLSGGDTLQLYPAEIEWGLHATQASQTLKLSLNYALIRPDPVEDHRGGFRIATRRRLESLTLTHGARRLRHWQLEYQPGTPVSLLASFRVYGDDRAVMGPGAEKNRDYLPPMTFQYAPSKLGADAVFTDIGPFFNAGFAQGEADFVDLNHDGLPDLLLAEGGTYFSRLNRGPGRGFGPLEGFTSGMALPALTTPGVKLADFRGDARTKVMIPDGGGFYYRDFTGPTTVGGDVDYPVPGQFPLTDPQVQLMDVNNDRALDFLALDDGRASWVLSSPSGAAPVFGEQARDTSLAGVDFTTGEWQLADLNGDRIPDLAQIVLNRFSRTGLGYRPGYGYGRFAADVPMSGGPLESELGGRGRVGLSLVDLDLDGLADLVYVDSGVVKIWRNLAGTAWADQVSLTSAQVPDWNEGSTAVRFTDLNGNGTVDLVWNDPSAGIFLRHLELHPATRPHQLTALHNGIGKSTEITYRDTTSLMLDAEAAGQPWTVRPPFPLPVVTRFTERDGMGGTYITEVDYRNGYYDAAEREFRGFDRAVVTEVGDDTQHAPSLVSEYDFDTGAAVEALKGRPKRVVARETGGAVFHDVVSDWTPRALPVTVAPGETRKLTFTFLGRETKHLIEKGQGTPVTLLKEFDFDDYGNPTLLADYGRVEGADRAAWNDERILKRTFSAGYSANHAKWMINYPVTERIEALDGKPAAETLYFYDDPIFSGANAGGLSQGNRTLIRKLVDPASDRFLNAERGTFDAFGNLVYLLDPLGTVPGAPHSRTIVHEDILHTHPISETIHIGSGAVGSVTMKAGYDLGLGVLTESQDFNGHRTFYAYDPLGRVISITKPGDTPEFPTESYDYRLGNAIAGGRTINWIETRQRETTGGGTVDSRTFFDGLGRKVMRRAEGEDSGQIVVSDTVAFNQRRTEWRNYLPYFENGTLDFADPAFSNPFQEKQYDAAGRILRTYQPDTGNGRAFSETVYSPLSRLQRDEEQTRESSPHHGAGMRYIEDGLQDKDGKGRLRTVEEIVKVDDSGEFSATPNTWTTRYRYDTLGNFTGYTDSRGNEKHFLYDALSRRVFMNDPDRGHYWWAYDDAGNVLRTCDAKNQHLVYSHDGANRIAAEWHLSSGAGGASPAPGAVWSNPPGVPEATPDAAYHYDVSAGPLPREALWRPRETEGLAQVVLGRLPASAGADLNSDGAVDVRDIALRASSPAIAGSVTAANTLGRLAWVRDQSGEEHLSYDARGRAVWKVKRFRAAPEEGMLSFLTENRFDSMDRPARHIYPDGTYVDNFYNTRGLLESITAAINRVDYNPAGQNLRIDLANGVRSDFDYDERLRVEEIESVRTRDGTALQSRVFGYDDVSNITGITDVRTPQHRSTILSEIASLPGFSATDLVDTFAFKYDSLYRVTEAQGPSHGTHRYRFDPIGNLTRQSYQGDARFTPPDMGTLTYGETGYGPHVLTGVTRPAGATAFTYDANGNMTSGTNGAVMTWDPKDRMTGASEAGIVHQHTYDYASKHSIHRETKGGIAGSPTFYIDDVSEFRGGRLIKYLYVGSEKVARSDFSGPPDQAIVPDLLYLHDHLGSTAVAMDRTGQVRQISSYAPYGHNRFQSLPAAKSIDYGFSGKELHEGPDLAYFETRFLSMHLARFINVDSLALSPPQEWLNMPRKWQSYAYAGGNPIGNIDVDGKDEKNIHEQDVGQANDVVKPIIVEEIVGALAGAAAGKVAGGVVGILAAGKDINEGYSNGSGEGIAKGYADVALVMAEFIGLVSSNLAMGVTLGLYSPSLANAELNPKNFRGYSKEETRGLSEVRLGDFLNQLNSIPETTIRSYLDKTQNTSGSFLNE